MSLRSLCRLGGAVRAAGGGRRRAQFGLADKLVFSKVRERLGGQVRMFISGSAALSPDVAEWFNIVGMPILEGYGLTETSAATAIVRPDNIKFGTVGEAVPGTEVKIAEDGEILVKGEIVFQGYYKNDAATAEVLDADGRSIGVVTSGNFSPGLGRGIGLALVAPGSAPAGVDVRGRTVAVEPARPPFVDPQ